MCTKSPIAKTGRKGGQKNMTKKQYTKEFGC